MKHQHSPGPWVTLSSQNTVEVYEGSTDNRLAVVYAEGSGNLEANARLIAAAPEMYQLLHRMWASMDPCDRNCRVISQLLDRIDSIKATGGANE